MRLIGRNATEAELNNMAKPFNSNTGEQWTPILIRDCIEKGALEANEIPEVKKALEEGIQALKIDQDKR